METKQPESPNHSAGRRAFGEMRVRAAMEHVQEAQTQLAAAISDLASVIGYVAEGDRLYKLERKVRAEWYRLNDKVGALPTRHHPHFGELDHEPTKRDETPHSQGCGGRRI